MMLTLQIASSVLPWIFDFWNRGSCSLCFPFQLLNRTLFPQLRVDFSATFKFWRRCGTLAFSSKQKIRCQTHFSRRWGIAVLSSKFQKPKSSYALSRFHLALAAMRCNHLARFLRECDLKTHLGSCRFKFYRPNQYKEAPKRELTEEEKILAASGRSDMIATAAPELIAGTTQTAMTYIYSNSKSKRFCL